MSISTEQVKKIAKLSRIALRKEEVEPFQQNLSNILDWVEQLSEVDTSDVEQMFSPSQFDLPLRQDEVNDGDDADSALTNAPKSDYGCYIVPKVVE